MNHRLLSAVLDLQNDIRDLSVGNHVPVLSQAPTPMEFLREFVAPNRPCIIANAVSHWPALRLWTNEYLRSKIGSTIVSVDCTPDGRGDAVVDVGPESMSKPYNGLLCRTSSDALTTAEVLDEPLHRHGHSSLDLSVHIGECSVENTRLASQTKIGTALRSHGNATEGSEHDSFEPSPNSPPAVHEHNSNIDPHESGRVVSSSIWFVTPHTHRMPFHSFLDLHSHSRSTESAPRIPHSTTSPSCDPPTTNQTPPDKGNRFADKGSRVPHCVPYIQHQNGSFTSEYAALAHDAQPHLPWASEALGGMPEAVNMWIGDERSVTSFHKDHYENLYAVVAGEKHFTLLPPTDVARLYMKHYPAAHYHQDSPTSYFSIIPDCPPHTVPWSRLDPYPDAATSSTAHSSFPLYFEGPPPLTCTLCAGDVLYLPSLWFHHVRQSPDVDGRTIAVNYWYDMRFDIKYAYFAFVERLLQVDDYEEDEAGD